MADFPRAPLLKFDALHGIPGLPILMSTYRFHSIEALYGAVSFLTGASVLTVSHLVSAPFWGFLAPLAWARLMRTLAPERWPWAVAAAVGFLLVDGSGHAGWGNVGFVRLFQGKAVFVTVLVPLTAAYALRFGEDPTPRRWLQLAAALVASAGLTGWALWAAPLTAAAGFWPRGGRGTTCARPWRLSPPRPIRWPALHLRAGIMRA